METTKNQRTERLPGRSAEYAVAFVLLLAFAGFFAGISAATLVGILSGLG